MAKFIYKKRIGRRSRKDTKLVNSVAVERKAIFSSVFQNENNGNYFELEDVQIIRYKRNRTVNKFFETYSDKSKYQLFEFGVPFHISDNLSVIIKKLKRKCESINNQRPSLMEMVQILAILLILTML